MNSNKWQKIKELFNQAVELDENEYELFLHKQTEIESEILNEVQKLLEAEKQNNFAQPIANLSQLWQEDQIEDYIGKEIGGYKIVKEIGRGGMGIVFEAIRQKDDFSQTVALKLLKRGMDSDAMLRRFIHERQILASLEHPNIARLLDGGRSDEGTPFFALELVKGQPIDEYCSEKNLTLQQRLRLFVQVCSAVSFAHSRLIVHRDLKPSNILVTTEGTVKLLDFGIAKIISSEENLPMQTVTSLGMMTPKYASPEQISGQIVSTSSDIYSLGLILYELLTGVSAYQFPNKRPDEIAKIICEVEPPYPSSVANNQWSKENFETDSDSKQTTNPKSKTQNPKSLKGDLDNIILKSLSKKINRRYDSVEQFSSDILRHLDGLPVIARPDTFSYRLEKFVKRNRISVVAGSLVFLTLTGGIITTSWQAYRAEQQRVLAEKRFSEVRQMANNVVFKYDNEAQKLIGSTKMREIMVKDALLYLDGLTSDSAGDSSLRQEIGLAYLRIGKIQGKPFFANLGDTKGAVESYKKGITQLEPLISTTSDVKLQWDFVNAVGELSEILRRQGNITESDIYQQRATQLNERFLAVNPNDPTLLTRSAYNYYSIGDTLPIGQSENENISFYRKSILAAQKVLESDSNHLRANNILAAATQRIGANLILLAHNAEEIGDKQKANQLTNEAIPYYQNALKMGVRLVELQPNDALYEGIVSAAKVNECEYLIQNKDYQKALRIALEGLQNYENKLKADEKNNENKLNLTYLYTTLNRIYLRLNNLPKAIETHRKMNKLFDELITGDVENLDYRQKRQQNNYIYADELLKIGKISEARKIYTDEFNLFEPKGMEKDSQYTLSIKGFYLEKIANCDLAESKNTNLTLEKQRVLINSALLNFEKALEIWTTVGSQIAPGVRDAEKIEIVKKKVEFCRNALKN